MTSHTCKQNSAILDDISHYCIILCLYYGGFDRQNALKMESIRSYNYMMITIILHIDYMVNAYVTNTEAQSGCLMSTEQCNC